MSDKLYAALEIEPEPIPQPKPLRPFPRPFPHVELSSTSQPTLAESNRANTQ